MQDSHTPQTPTHPNQNPTPPPPHQNPTPTPPHQNPTPPPPPTRTRPHPPTPTPANDTSVKMQFYCYGNRGVGINNISFEVPMVSRRFRLPKTGASRCVATCEQSNAGAVNASFSSGDQDQSVWSMNPLGTTSQNSLFFKAPACSACHIDLTDTSRNQALRHGASFRTTWTWWGSHGGKDPPPECFPENGVTQRCPKTADAM